MNTKSGKTSIIHIIKKIISVMFISVLTLTLALYIALNIYVSSKAVKIRPSELKNESTVELSDWQLQCASEIFNKNKNPKFARLPLIIDAFSVRNSVAFNVACIFGAEDNPRFKRPSTSIEWQFRDLATKRYIVRHINYKYIYNYFFSKVNFGISGYGLADASEVFFYKPYDQLEKEEFEKLCMVLINHEKYNLDAEWEKNSFINLKQTFENAKPLIKNAEDLEKLSYVVEKIYDLQNYEEPLEDGQRYKTYKKDNCILSLRHPGMYKGSDNNYSKAVFYYTSKEISANFFLQLGDSDLFIIIQKGGLRPDDEPEGPERSYVYNRFYKFNTATGFVKTADFYWD